MSFKFGRMKLEDFTTDFQNFIRHAVERSKSMVDSSEVSIVGVHLDPREGYVAFAVHTSPVRTNEALPIPDFTHPEIHAMQIDEWQDEHWERDKEVSYDGRSASSDSSDEEYADLFVDWASSLLQSMTADLPPSYQKALFCVHPVSSDPFRVWTASNEI